MPPGYFITYGGQFKNLEEANKRLAENNGMIASFSRALSEGLSDSQRDDEFTKILETSINSIFEASRT